MGKSSLGNRIQICICIEHIEHIFYSVYSETLEQDAQRSCECHITEIVPDQVGWGFEKPDILVDDHCVAGVVGQGVLSRSLTK